jgi:hypothetical protein
VSAAAQAASMTRHAPVSRTTSSIFSGMLIPREPGVGRTRRASQLASRPGRTSLAGIPRSLAITVAFSDTIATSPVRQTGCR